MALVEKIVSGSYKAACMLLVPIILMVGMMVITLIHQVLIDLVSGNLTGSILSLITFLIHMMSLGAFCALLWFLYAFVKNNGWRLFE